MRILIAEDCAESQLHLKRLLTRWGHEVVATSNGLAAWQLLQGRDAPPAAILDWQMPGIDGIDVCRKVRAESEAPFVYLVLLTAKVEQHDIIEGMEAGADDYLKKPFDPEELKARLRAGQRIIELHQGLLQQATHDALTGLLNRRAIMDFLRSELARARRSHDPVAVVIADIDHFKRINDTYGHVTGDDVLRDVSQVLRASLHPADALGRYGGEEFLIVLPGCDEKSAVAAAERMRQIMQRNRALIERVGPITLSLGVAISHRDEFAVETLIKMADEALYRAKQAGRNKVESARPRDDISQTFRFDPLRLFESSATTGKLSADIIGDQ